MIISNPTARFGEDIATNYLRKKGYKIIERNFRKGYGEIDIISTFENILVFVEVKTRATGLYGGAIEAISYSKLQKLVRTCEYYKLLHP
jgi:putative endonuclease